MELRRLTESFPGRVARKFNEDQGPKHAALIAWNALTAVFPMVLFMASILGFALSFAGFKAGAFYTDVAALFPDSSVQQEVFKALDGVKSRTGLLFVVGLAGMLWGGSNLFGAMEDSFASIYHTRNRGFIGQKLLAFAMMLIFTVLAGSIVLSSTLLPAVEKLPYVPGFLRAGPGPIVRGLRFSAVQEKGHPHDAHVYLWFLAVDPKHQRGGVGRALLARVYDDATAAVYLDTANPANVPYYVSNGYEELGKADGPRGASMWFMRRA
jgi:GNAT superfamily N-acetyltransferase